MPSLPWLHPDRVHALETALAQRILIIDGAMGTMIQRHGLEEDDYRGERFAGQVGRPGGRPDLAHAVERSAHRGRRERGHPRQEPVRPPQREH